MQSPYRIEDVVQTAPGEAKTLYGLPESTGISIDFISSVDLSLFLICPKNAVYFDKTEYLQETSIICYFDSSYLVALFISSLAARLKMKSSSLLIMLGSKSISKLTFSSSRVL